MTSDIPQNPISEEDKDSFELEGNAEKKESSLPPNSSNASVSAVKKRFQVHEDEDDDQFKMWLFWLRSVTSILLFVSVLWALWLFVDMNEKNEYLSQYGIQDNTFTRFDDARNRQEDLEEQIADYEYRITEINDQIENKEYSSFTNLIRDLKSEQLVFFNTPDVVTTLIQDLRSSSEPVADVLKRYGLITTQQEQMEIESYRDAPVTDTDPLRLLLTDIGATESQYGILETPFHVKNYLSSPSFEDIILSSDNVIDIQNVTINRNFLTFEVEAGNTLFGTTFYLYTKFIDLLNAFPFLEDGELTVFEKEKDEIENYMMRSTIRFRIVRDAYHGLQSDTEETNDTQQQNLFLDFQDWFQSDTTNEDLLLFQ